MSLLSPKNKTCRNIFRWNYVDGIFMLQYSLLHKYFESYQEVYSVSIVRRSDIQFVHKNSTSSNFIKPA